VPLDRALAAAARDLRRPLAQLGDQRLHALAPRREDIGVALDPRGQQSHGAEPSAAGRWRDARTS
jgi:hypothetical protein